MEFNCSSIVTLSFINLKGVMTVKFSLVRRNLALFSNKNQRRVSLNRLSYSTLQCRLLCFNSLFFWFNLNACKIKIVWIQKQDEEHCHCCCFKDQQRAEMFLLPVKAGKSIYCFMFRTFWEVSRNKADPCKSQGFRSQINKFLQWMVPSNTLFKVKNK